MKLMMGTNLLILQFNNTLSKKIPIISILNSIWVKVKIFWDSV